MVKETVQKIDSEKKRELLNSSVCIYIEKFTAFE